MSRRNLAPLPYRYLNAALMRPRLGQPPAAVVCPLPLSVAAQKPRRRVLRTARLPPTRGPNKSSGKRLIIPLPTPAIVANLGSPESPRRLKLGAILLPTTNSLARAIWASERPREENQ